MAGLALTGGLSGCAETEKRPVSLSVSNATPRKQSLFVEILPADIEKQLSENDLFAEWIDVGPAGEDTSYVEQQNVFDAAKALVRVKNSHGYIREYTFVPDCPDLEQGEHIEIRLLSENNVVVEQNWCRT